MNVFYSDTLGYTLLIFNTFRWSSIKISSFQHVKNDLQIINRLVNSFGKDTDTVNVDNFRRTFDEQASHDPVTYSWIPDTHRCNSSLINFSICEKSVSFLAFRTRNIW